MSTVVTNYVLCIITGDNYILLLKKNKDWQAGLYNFPGGKVEYYDSLFVSAATRETKEETGLDVYTFENKGKIIVNVNAGDYTYTDKVINIFHADIGSKIKDAETLTSEEVVVIPIEDFKSSLYRDKSIGNIHAIYDLIADGITDMTIEYTNEV